MVQRRSANVDLTVGPIISVLMRQFMPTVVSSLVFASVSVAEGYFVSRLGTAPLAVFGQLSPFILLATGMFFGFSNGVTSTVSRAAGSGRPEAASAAASLAYLLVMPFVIVYLLMCSLLAKPIFELMGGTEERFGLFNSFLWVWECAIPIAILLYVSAAILRAQGLAGVASAMFITSSLINLMMGPALMFGWGSLPRLGLQGAAISALIGMLVAGLASVSYLLRRNLLGFKFERARELSKDIFIGSSFAVSTYCIQPMGRLLLLAIIGASGTKVMAAMTVLLFADRFMLNIFVALSSALAPFVGQNWGKGRYDRAYDGTTGSLVAALTIGLVAWLVFWSLSSEIAAQFTSDHEVFVLIRAGFQLYPLYILLSALVLIATAAFNATANAGLATIFVSLGQLVVLPSCVYFGGVAVGFQGMLAGMVVAQFAIAGGAVGCLYKRVLNRAASGEYSHAVALGKTGADRVIS